MGGVGPSGPIGRGSELARLATFLDRPDSFPSALLLEGEPGIGKTTLWRAGVTISRERSYRTLTCNPGPAEARIAFGALGDLLDDAADEALPDLPDPQRRALRVALLLEEPEGPPPDQRATFTAVLGVLRRLASTVSVLVAIDDIHFLDPPSAAALEFVARRLGEAQIGLLLSLRAGEAPEFAERLERCFDEDGFERVLVGPLTLAEIHHVLLERQGTSFPRSTLRRIHEESRGNPLLAIEIGRALRERDGELAVTDPLPVPTEMRELLTARLDALPRPTRKALLPVAALAEPTLELVEHVVGPDAATRLEPAFEARVLEWDEERIRFTHPLLSSTVYANSGPPERRDVHRRLAEALPLPEERARHLALAAEGPDPDVAEALDAAAVDAAARGLPGEAADLIELALRLTPPGRPDDIQRRKSEAATYHFLGGRVARSRELLHGLLQELPAGPVRARVLLGLAWSENDMRRARALGEQALAEGGDEPWVQASAEHLLTFLGFGMGKLHAALPHARSALAAAEQTSDLPLVAETLSAKLIADTLAGVPIDPRMVERGLDLERRLQHVPLYYPPSLGVAYRLATLDRQDEARERFQDAYRRATETGDEVSQAATLFHWTDLECRASRFRRAQQLGKEGYEITQQIGFGGREAPLLSVLSMAEARLGRSNEARRFARRGVEMARRNGMGLFEIWSGAVLGSLELSLGDPETALEHLRPLPTGLREGGLRDPSLGLAVPDAIEAMVAVGDLEAARREVEWLEECVEAAGNRWGITTAVRCRGLLSAAEGDLDEALASFEEALALHWRLPQPYEHGRTLLALGTTLRRARRNRQAREALTQARDIFEQLEAKLWAERAGDELARIGGRAPSSLQLTPAEGRVADLVASGLSNKEVAAKLVISVHTVESQLSSVYAKLGIHSRTELTRHIVSEDQNEP